MATPMEDLELPKAVVLRLAKAKVPETTQFSKEARTVLSQAATIFVSYLAATTSDIAKSKGQKNINVPNILQALDEMDFTSFVEPVREHGQAVSERRTRVAAAKRKSKSLATPSKDDDDKAPSGGNEEGADDDEEEEEHENADQANAASDAEDASEESDKEDIPASPSKRPRSS